MPVDNSDTNKFCTKACLAALNAGFLLCKCGQEMKRYEWKFQLPEIGSNVELKKNKKYVLFHPPESEGTALVTSNTPFEKDRHYYWEVKALTELSGVDVMIGVGTGRINNDQLAEQCSLLGLDANSWGYSYRGVIQHDKVKQDYGIPFGVGCLVGVHLDMWLGTLEYYVNRRARGVAFKGLKKHKMLYPMMSATNYSIFRTICTVSVSTSLELYCLKAVMKHPQLYQTYRCDLPQIAEQLERKYFWLQPSNEVLSKIAIRRRMRKRSFELSDEELSPYSTVSANDLIKRFKS